MSEAPELRRYVRLRHVKRGPIRFTSQRDIARVAERLLRRAHLPVGFSEGFSPRPLLSFSLALPTGGESDAEYIDARLEGEIPNLAELVASLDAMAPEGLGFVSAGAWQGSRGSLQQQVTSATWEMEVVGMSTTAVLERTAELLGAPELQLSRTRKGKVVHDDVRPAILSLEPAPELAGREGPSGTTQWVRTELATTGRGLRPQELIALIGEDLNLVRPVRRAQWITDDRGRFEPLTATGELPPADLAADLAVQP